ncbi:hypothetical protein CspHIS471_0703000 [Cutaneotrichosporon sp. HIS471]|nr:hypothetical protein CspHIS471_0703000 [Cutaneotrichosporon sp. HIS471]
MPFRDLFRPRRTSNPSPSATSSTAAYARGHRPTPAPPQAYVDPPPPYARSELASKHEPQSDFAAGLVSGVIGTLVLLWLLGWLGREGECAALKAGLGEIYTRLGEVRGTLAHELGEAQEVVGDVLRRDALK